MGRKAPVQAVDSLPSSQTSSLAVLYKYDLCSQSWEQLSLVDSLAANHECLLAAHDNVLVMIGKHLIPVTALPVAVQGVVRYMVHSFVALETFSRRSHCLVLGPSRAPGNIGGRRCREGCVNDSASQ